jgi:chromosome segregation ATPase
MDQDLIAYLDERFREASQHAERRHEETMGRLGGVEGRLERVEEDVRYSRIEVEGLRGELRLVAEAYIGLDEKLSSFRIEMADEFKKFETLHLRLLVVENRAANSTRDVMALVRERLGKPPLPEDLV